MAANIGAAVEATSAKAPDTDSGQEWKLKRDHVWVWDGPANTLGPSIYGLGETTKYLHSDNVVCMWLSSKTKRPAAFKKLKDFKRVVWDLTRTTWRGKHVTPVGEEAQAVGFFMEDSWSEGRGEESKEEALKVSKFSKTYGNIDGGILDYSFGGFASRGGTPADLKEIQSALKADNPSLKLYWMQYTQDVDPKWSDYLPYVDVISLWEPKRDNLKNLDASLDRCAEVFPGKPILLGLYLADYWAQRLGAGEKHERQWHRDWAVEPIPVDLLELQFSKAVQYVKEGRIIGFSILAGALVDMFPETAEWIRNFLEKELAGK